MIFVILIKQSGQVIDTARFLQIEVHQPIKKTTLSL